MLPTTRMSAKRLFGVSFMQDLDLTTQCSSDAKNFATYSNHSSKSERSEQRAKRAVSKASEARTQPDLTPYVDPKTLLSYYTSHFLNRL